MGLYPPRGSTAPLRNRRGVWYPLHYDEMLSLICCTAAQTSSIPRQVAADCALASVISSLGSTRTHHPTVPGSLPRPLSPCFALPFFMCLPLSLSVCLALSLPLRPFSFSFSSPSPGVSLVSLPRLTPPCLMVPVKHTAARMAVCSAACRGTSRRLRIPGPFA